MIPGGETPDLSAILAQAQALQQQMADAQASLAQQQVTGTAGGGLVTATVSGEGELLALEISESVVDPTDVESLQDLVVAAVRDASRAASELAQQTLGPLAGGLGGMGLPGM